MHVAGGVPDGVFGLKSARVNIPLVVSLPTPVQQ